MKCNEIINIINQRYPETDACCWDNVGLQVGRFDKDVNRIFLALDATDDVIAEAIAFDADMLITHHPMIFSGLKKINQSDFIGRRVLILAQHDVSYYAMHTNYDIHGMADLAMDKLGVDRGEPLEVTKETEGKSEGIGRILSLDTEVTLSALASKVKKSFELENVRVYGNPDNLVKRLAVCPGSGKSEISLAIGRGADVFVTGDVGHHDCLDALEQGLCIIDAGHYGLEHIFIEDMREYLHSNLQNVEIKGAELKHPFFNI